MLSTPGMFEASEMMLLSCAMLPLAKPPLTSDGLPVPANRLAVSLTDCVPLGT